MIMPPDGPYIVDGMYCCIVASNIQGTQDRQFAPTTMADPLSCCCAECAPGYAKNGTQCDLCHKGDYCPGGSSAAVSCGDGLTTLTEGARSVDQCGKFLLIHVDIDDCIIAMTALLRSAQLKPNPVCLHVGLSAQ